jgi:hypothetical protein
MLTLKYLHATCGSPPFQPWNVPFEISSTRFAGPWLNPSFSRIRTGTLMKQTRGPNSQSQTIPASSIRACDFCIVVGPVILIMINTPSRPTGRTGYVHGGLTLCLACRRTDGFKLELSDSAAMKHGV